MVTVAVLGAKIVKNSKGRKEILWVGIMSLVLVVLWADVNPIIGMFMLPKTCMYIWMVVMGYNTNL